MPYISESRRKELDDRIRILVDAAQKGNANTPATSGDLNYIITSLLVYALNLDFEPKYDKINTAIGLLECVKLELYRRLGSVYENTKIQKEGDIPVYLSFDKWLQKSINKK